LGGEVLVPSALAERIRSDREEIVAAWEAGVRTLASAARAPQPALVNRVPDFLDWLANRLERSDLPDSERDLFSHHHTVERLSQGFDLVEVVAEWALLRDCLLEAWARAPDGITPAEIRRMDLELDHVVAVSVVQYARELGAAEAGGARGARAPEGTGASQAGHP
jgi:hypothetical protein